MPSRSSIVALELRAAPPYPPLVHRRLAILLVPLALACHPKPGRDGTASPSSGSASPPAATNPIDFSRIFLAQSEGQYWRAQHGMFFPESVGDAVMEELDGIERKLDVVKLGIESPFAEGDAAVLVTTEGTFEARVSGIGGWRGGWQDWLAAVLEGGPAAPSNPPPDAPAPRGFAVFGAPPNPSARIVPLPAVPLGARVGLALESAKAELPKLKADFVGDLPPEETDPRLAELRVGTECAKTFAPALAPGFEQLLVVHCNEGSADPALSGIVVLGEHPQVLYPWNLHTWGLELLGVVDLDGDGIDELWVEAGGHEWWSTSLWRWDGKQYVEEEISSDSL